MKITKILDRCLVGSVTALLATFAWACPFYPDCIVMNMQSGDPDGSGALASADVELAMMALEDESRFTCTALAILDVNADGSFDALDVSDMQVTLTAGGDLEDLPGYGALIGDVDADGWIGTADVKAIDDLIAVGKVAGVRDIDGDGLVDAGDSLELQRCLDGDIKHLGALGVKSFSGFEEGSGKE